MFEKWLKDDQEQKYEPDSDTQKLILEMQKQDRAIEMLRGKKNIECQMKPCSICN